MNKEKSYKVVMEYLEDREKCQLYKQALEDINYYIEQRIKENITDELKIELKNIELISKGIIKVVKGE